MIISDALKILKGSTESVRAFAGGSQVWAKIVTNGLALFLDAGNNNSYPGNGTTWYDLSGNGNNGTQNQIGCCAKTTSVKFKDPTHKSTVIKIRPIETS